MELKMTAKKKNFEITRIWQESNNDRGHICSAVGVDGVKKIEYTENMIVDIYFSEDHYLKVKAKEIEYMRKG